MSQAREGWGITMDNGQGLAVAGLGLSVGGYWLAVIGWQVAVGVGGWLGIRGKGNGCEVYSL